MLLLLAQAGGLSLPMISDYPFRRRRLVALYLALAVFRVLYDLEVFPGYVFRVSLARFRLCLA